MEPLCVFSSSVWEQMGLPQEGRREEGKSLLGIGVSKEKKEKEVGLTFLAVKFCGNGYGSCKRNAVCA